MEGSRPDLPCNCCACATVNPAVYYSGMRPQHEDADDERVRLDKWLWAARFFKTRALASEAIGGGKVQVNGDRAKRARPLQVGDEVRVRLGPYEHTVVVKALSAHRGPASVAVGLYEERPESLAAREAMAVQLKTLHAAFVPEKGRPTKRDRREIDRLRGRE
jgi:ribosome-associated heat shock protein Hsp15